MSMGSPDTLLLVTTSYPRWTNGREAAGSFVADVAQALTEYVNVRVVAPGDRDEIEQKSPRLAIYRYAAPQRRLVNLRMWNPVDAWRILATLRAGSAAVNMATRDGNVFHSLALWALPPGRWAQSAWRKHGIPYSVWMLGSDVWLLGRIPFVRGILRRVMRDAKHRFADGLQLAEDSRRICGKDVAFLPSTRHLDTRDFGPPAQVPPYSLVFIGRWHHHKGIDLLLDGLAMLDDEDWERISEMRIFGGGPLAATVMEKAKVLLEAGRPLDIGGFIPKAEAERAIVRADYLVIPSRIESIPVVFSDAMKLGRPVISTPVGDLPLLFGDTPCGVMADEISVTGIYQALKKALYSSPASFVSAVREQASKFDLDVIAKEILAVSVADRHGEAVVHAG